MGLILIMLALLVGCYALCAALVLFAEQVIRPRVPEEANPADLALADTMQETSSR